MANPSPPDLATEPIRTRTTPGSVAVVGAATVVGNRSDTTTFDADIDAFALMTAATKRALDEAGARSADYVVALEGTWPGDNAAAVVSERLGLAATTAMAYVGVTQDEVLAQATLACEQFETVVVVGGEATFTARHNKRAGREPPAVPQAAQTPADFEFRTADLAIADIELTRDIVSPSTGFALMESAIRHHRIHTVAEHDGYLTALQRALDHVAAANPHAWRTRPLSPAEIHESRMIADPYRRAMCSDWTVDLASAVVLMSDSNADRRGVATGRRARLVGTAFSNHSVPVPARQALHSSVAVRRAFETLAGQGGPLHPESTAIELYSCFPASLGQWAEGLVDDAVGLWPAGRPLDPSEWTCTGGMAAAGGPLNNAAVAGWVAIWERLCGDRFTEALSTSVSGSFTKHGATRWTSRPAGPAVVTDVSALVATSDPALAVDETLDGRVHIVAHTVDRRWPRAVAIIERDGARSVAHSTEAPIVESFAHSDLVGSTADIAADGTIESVGG